MTFSTINSWYKPSMRLSHMLILYIFEVPHLFLLVVHVNTNGIQMHTYAYIMYIQYKYSRHIKTISQVLAYNLPVQENLSLQFSFSLLDNSGLLPPKVLFHRGTYFLQFRDSVNTTKISFRFKISLFIITKISFYRAIFIQIDSKPL